MKCKKVLSVVLALTMVVSLFAGITVTAGAVVGMTISLDKSALELSVGGATGKLTAKVMDPNDQDITGDVTVEWDSEDATVATVENGTVTAVKAGTTTITARVQNAGYEATCTVTVYDGIAYLDLENSTTDIPISKDIDQNYTLDVTENYTNKTKVKLTWNITDIAASRTDSKTWNPDKLSWDDSSSDTTVGTNGTATFTLTNLSSVKVSATASFAAAGSFNPTVAYTDSAAADITSTTANTSKAVTLGTVVKSNKSVDTSIDHDETITAAITPGDGDFKTLPATDSATKYGTYTITIGAYVPQTLNVSEVVYSGRGEYEVANTLIYEGTTWQEIVTNNANNKVTLSLYGVDDVICTLQISGTNVILEGNNGESFALITEDSEQATEQKACIQTTDAVTGTLYFYAIVP